MGSFWVVLIVAWNTWRKQCIFGLAVAAAALCYWIWG